MGHVQPYEPVEGVEFVTLTHPDLTKERGEDVTIDVYPEQVELYERSGWKKASAKVAKAAGGEE